MAANEGRDFITPEGRTAVHTLICPELDQLYATFKSIGEKTKDDPAARSTAISACLQAIVSAAGGVAVANFGWVEVYSNKETYINHTTSFVHPFFFKEGTDSTLVELLESLYRELGTERYEALCAIQHWRDGLKK